MHTRFLGAAAFAALFLVAPAVAQDPAPQPDSVVLKNGDRITGSAQSITSDVVKLKSTPLGDLEIALGEVDNITTSAPIRLETPDLVTDGVVQGLEDGAVRVGSGAEVRSIPTADLIVPMPPVEWTGSVNVGGQISTGNTERRAVSAGAEAIRRTREDRLRLRGTFDYAEDKDTSPTAADNSWRLSQRRTYGQAKYDYFLSKKMYLLATTSGENDELSRLHLRFTGGAGVGYQWYDRDDLSVLTEVGLSYVDEDYSGGPDTDFLAARGALSVRWTIMDGLKLLHDSEVFPSLEESDDFYARLDTRLQATLTDNLFAQFQWILDYDNTPAQGRQRDDHRLLASVGWSF